MELLQMFVCLGCGLVSAPLLIPPECLSTHRKAWVGPTGTSLKGKRGQWVQLYMHVRVRCSLPSLSLVRISYWGKRAK